MLTGFRSFPPSSGEPRKCNQISVSFLLTWEQPAVWQMQFVEDSGQQSEAKQLAGRSQTSTGQKVHIPGDRLIEDITGAL